MDLQNGTLCFSCLAWSSTIRSPKLTATADHAATTQATAAAAAAGAASGSLQSRPPAKQSVVLARPTAVFSSGGVRPPSPAPVAGQTASKPPVSAADMLPAARRKKRKLMDNRLPEKVTCAMFIVLCKHRCKLQALAKQWVHMHNCMAT